MVERLLAPRRAHQLLPTPQTIRQVVATTTTVKPTPRPPYLLDPVTGDVFWLFPDGTWAVDHAQGPLAPTKKRWVQTSTQRRQRRSKRAAARAAAAEFETYQDEAPERVQAREKLDPAFAQADTDLGWDPHRADTTHLAHLHRPGVGGNGDRQRPRGLPSLRPEE